MKLYSLFIIILTITACMLSAQQPTENEMWIDVRELGAKGDGLSDDTDFFQQALDTLSERGGVLYVPAGDYRISQTLLLSNGSIGRDRKMNFTRIQGEGSASRLLGDGVDYILGAKRIPSEKDRGGFSYLNGLQVNQITFRSYDASNRCGGIDASYLLRWESHNCYYVNLTTGIFSLAREPELEKSVSVWIIRIRNNQFTGCQDFAIKLGRIFDLVIENNIIEHGRGGIAVGTPGDRFNAAANTIRIENNVIEGLTHNPAILGSCWISATISGNYFEANGGGDIVLTPANSDGGIRSLTIQGNSFQPTPKQRESGQYGPIHLRKVSRATITGNFTTGNYLLHPDSKLGRGVNIASNTLRDSPAVGEMEGADPAASTDYLNESVPPEHAEKWEVTSPVATVGIHSLFGFQYKPTKGPAQSISFGEGFPTTDRVQYQQGDLIFNQSPRIETNKRILIGWICMESGKPGTWKPLYALTD